MPDQNEQDALSKIKAYLDAGHSFDAIRQAGWASWIDHLEAKGYDLRTGLLALRPPGETPLPDDPVRASDEGTRQAATVSDAAPPEQRRGGILRWGLIGCLGIFAAVGVVVVGIVVLIVIAISSSDLSSAEDTRVSFAEGSSGTVETAGDVRNKVTIDTINDPAISDNQFSQPAAGFHYLTISVTIENAGERETTGGDFTLRTTDGFEYDQTFVSGVGASDLNFLQGLTSGGKTNAVLAFEVPDGSRVEWLKFDPNPFAAGDLYFDKE